MLQSHSLQEFLNQIVTGIKWNAKEPAPLRGAQSPLPTMKVFVSSGCRAKMRCSIEPDEMTYLELKCPTRLTPLQQWAMDIVNYSNLVQWEYSHQLKPFSPLSSRQGARHRTLSGCRLWHLRETQPTKPVKPNADSPDDHTLAMQGLKSALSN